MMNLAKKSIVSMVLTLMTVSANATTVQNLTLDSVTQYSVSALTVLHFKEDYRSPGGCGTSAWGSRAALVRTTEPYAAELISLALSALMTGAKVDVGMLATCDAGADSVQFIKVKGP